jgi:hypothetical protein
MTRQRPGTVFDLGALGETRIPALVVPLLGGSCHCTPLPGYEASFTVADATTLPFRVPISRNAARGPLGFNTTPAICPSLA